MSVSNETTSTLYKIEIRNIFRNFSKYYLEIYDEETKQTFKTKITKKCIIPTFKISFTDKEIYSILQTTNNKTLIITLFSLSDENNTSQAVRNCSFKINFPNSLIFLSENISDVKIDIYPSIIFEYSTGFYTHKADFSSHDKFIVNESYIYRKTGSQEILPKDAKENSIEQLLAERTKYQFTIKDIETHQEELEKSQVCVWDFFLRHKKGYNEFSQKKKLLLEIQKLSAKIQTKNETNDKLYLMLETIEEKIKEKKKNLAQINAAIADLKDKKKENIVYIEQIKKVSFSNKCIIKKNLFKLIRTFFSGGLTVAVQIPPFYNTNFTELDKKVRYKYYISHSENISLFFSYIVKVCTFLSKMFQITLPYNLFSNGLNSAVILKKKYYKLYLYNDQLSDKNEQCGNLEFAGKCLEFNIKQIMNFLMSKNLINEERAEILEIKKDKEVNIYYAFIRFVNYLNYLLNEIKK